MQINEIIQKLQTLPQSIYEAEIAFANKQMEYLAAKEILAKTETKLLLDGTIDGKNSEIREAQLKAKTAKERNDLFEAEVKMLLGKAEYNLKLNELSAYRAIARILGKED